MDKFTSKKFILIFNITVSIVLIFSISCSSIEVPAFYKECVLILQEELENIDKIPLETKTIASDPNNNIYRGIIDYSKRAEYLKRKNDVWDKMKSDLDNAQSSIKLDNWKDDILFCKALILLTRASIEEFSPHTDNAIFSMTEFIEYNKDNKIEDWTKKKLNKVFWSKMADIFSNRLTEKENINSFFHIGVASLFEQKKRNLKRAIEEYEKVLKIDTQGFFAKQAKAQIKLLAKPKG